MELNVYQIVYIMGNAFQEYMVYRFFHIFYPEQKAKKRCLEILIYLFCFAAAMLLHVSGTGDAAILGCNLVCLAAVSSLYRENFKKNPGAILVILLVLWMAEPAVLTLLKYLDKHRNMGSTGLAVFGIYASKIAVYTVVLFISSVQKRQKGVKVSIPQWIFMAVLPMGSCYLLSDILYISGDGMLNRVLDMTVLIVFLLNIGIFWLYDFSIQAMDQEYEKQILLKENLYFEKQLENQKQSIAVWKKLKHDLKNHLIVLMGMLEENEERAAKEYLHDLMNDRVDSRKEIQTGNTAIDSIVNYKLLEAKQRHIQFDLEIQIPENLQVSSYAMSVILGNAIDNALEAAEKTEEKRISLVIKYTKGRLLIRVSNPFSGRLDEKGAGRFRTGKADQKNHGLGLKNMEEAAEKLGGGMRVHTERQVFTLTMLLYVSDQNEKKVGD